MLRTAPVLASVAFMLAGCSGTLPPAGSIASASGALAGAVTAVLPPATATKVQAYTSKFCPTVIAVGTVTAVVAQNTKVDDALSIARAICQAVTAGGSSYVGLYQGRPVRVRVNGHQRRG